MRDARTSAGLGERCEIHGCSLTFYSSKEQGYKCLSCLINSSDVKYIDKSYIASLDKFNEIKTYTEAAITKNRDAMHDLGRWKDDVRDMVMRVRGQFIRFIDEFTLQLKSNQVDIENTPSMKEFIGEDRRQEYRLRNLEEKHAAISKIIETIEETPRHQKAAAVKSNGEEMQRLEQEVTVCETEIKEQRKKIQKVMHSTIDLESLSTQIFGQFFKFI